MFRKGCYCTLVNLVARAVGVDIFAYGDRAVVAGGCRGEEPIVWEPAREAGAGGRCQELCLRLILPDVSFRRQEEERARFRYELELGEWWEACVFSCYEGNGFCIGECA